jgi:hypothetical protein
VLRSVGLEDRVKAESEKQFDPDGGINAVESLAAITYESALPLWARVAR